MIVNTCYGCFGHPYTTDLSIKNCPVCGRPLTTESVDVFDLTGRTEFTAGDASSDPFDSSGTDFSFGKSFGESGFNKPDDNSLTPQFGQPTHLVPTGEDAPGSESVVMPAHPTRTLKKGKSARQDGVIVGKVSQYSNTGSEDGRYRRYLITRVFDAILYRQRMEDVLHRFKVRVNTGRNDFGSENTQEVFVNVHGTIAQGMQITDNCEVEVSGRYKNNVLMASSIYIIENGLKTKVKFQRSVPTIVCSILLVLALIFIGIFAYESPTGDFFENVKTFFIVWGIAFAVLTVLDVIFSFSKIGLAARFVSGKPKKFPLLAILILSFVISTFITAMILSGLNFSGLFGSLASSLVSILISIGILILVVYLFFKLIFGR